MKVVCVSLSNDSVRMYYHAKECSYEVVLRMCTTQLITNNNTNNQPTLIQS